MKTPDLSNYAFIDGIAHPVEKGDTILRFVDRHERDCCLGPTHEEVITDLVRREIQSYRQMPIKAALSAFSLGAGASVGPEDPSVQIGANLGSMVGQWRPSGKVSITGEVMPSRLRTVTTPPQATVAVPPQTLPPQQTPYLVPPDPVINTPPQASVAGQVEAERRIAGGIARQYEDLLIRSLAREIEAELAARLGPR